MSNQSIRGQQYVFYVPLVSRSTGQFQVNPTIAAGDFQVSKDGGAYVNLATLPVVEPAGSESVKVTLSASEMSASNVNFRGKDVSGAEWDDVFSNIQPISWMDANDIVKSNVILWASGTVVTPNLTGIPKVDLVDIDGLATNGNNATLKLKKLDVRNTAAGDYAVYLSESGSGGAALGIDGLGSGGVAVSLSATSAAVYAFSNKDGIIVDYGGDGESSPVPVGLKFIKNSPSGVSISATDGIIGSDSEDLSVTNIADKVWDEQNSEHLITGSTGKKLNDAGNAGDPWETTLPGSYAPGQAGHLLASRMPTGTVIVGVNQDKTGYSLSSPQAFDLIGNVSGTLTNVINVINPVGVSTGTFIDTITNAVWSYATRTLTAFGFGVTVTTNNDKTGYSLVSDYDPAKTAAQVSDIPTATENADALLKRDWTQVTGEAARSVLNALRKLRNKVSFNGTDTLTVTEEDDTTTAYTQPVVEDENQDPFKSIG